LNPVLLGQNVTAIIRTDNRIPYVQQWNFTIQRELPFHTNLQVAYVGTKGTFLAIQQKPVNQTDDIPQATLNSAISTYQATGTNPLTTLVPNPFFGIITNNTNLKNATIQQQYLDLPYPAYGSVTRFQDRIGSSNYNALQVTVKRAFNHGLWRRVCGPGANRFGAGQRLLESDEYGSGPLGLGVRPDAARGDFVCVGAAVRERPGSAESYAGGESDGRRLEDRRNHDFLIRFPNGDYRGRLRAAQRDRQSDSAESGSDHRKRQDGGNGANRAVDRGSGGV
jgi:hypothetical protein